MKSYQGYIYAVFAALLNAMIGIFSVEIMSTGLTPYAIAFYKCLIGLLILTSWSVVSKQLSTWVSYLKQTWWKLIITAFFGFFVLFFFETNAYKYEKVTIVVFTLLGSALISTFILSAILNKKWLNFSDIISCALALFGLGLIFGVNKFLQVSYAGIFLTSIAGIGYGIFLTIGPKFKIGSGLLVVNSLLLMGTIYLFVPFAVEGLVFITHTKTLFLLILLALLPTILGFYCTTKALALIKSESVQLIELSEPIFALVFSMLFLSQYVHVVQILGGTILILSIYIHLRKVTV